MMDHAAGLLKGLAIAPPRQAVGLGGTITTLSAVSQKSTSFNPSTVHGSSLSRQEVERQVLLYKGANLNQRIQIPGLPTERADVILAGAAVVLVTMRRLGLDGLTVSCHGLRYGVLYAATHVE